MTAPGVSARQSLSRYLVLPARSLCFYIAYIAITVGHGLLLPLCLFLPLARRRPLLLNWGRSTMVALRWLCRVDYRLEGTNNIPDHPCVVMINHQSVWETGSLFHLLPQLCLVAKKELFYIPIFGWGLALTGAIFIDRRRPQQAFQKIIKTARKRLEDGYSCLLYTSPSPRDRQKSRMPSSA